MKRTRRISIEIEHRETWVSLTIHDARADASRRNASYQSMRAATCSICGAPLALVVGHSGALNGSPVDQIAAAFLHSGLHPPIQVGDDLWVCSESFRHLNHSLEKT